jgi:glucose-6-phosphate-specific signal transduction histidine kinase
MGFERILNMSETTRRILYWAPHVLSIAFTLFISLFALDVFSHTQGFWRTLVALLMHLIPTFILLTMAILAWRWPWIGAVLSAGLCALFLWWNFTYRHNVPSAVLIIAGPLVLMTILYLIAWIKRGELAPR